MKFIRRKTTNTSSQQLDPVTLFLCGDVMTGRGIDQILPYPGEPVLHEPYIRDARDYVELAEEVSGSFPKPVDFSYIWGYALEVLEQVKPDISIINLETSITRSNAYWSGKEIHYRMNPDNIPVLTAAGIDCCSLANNHVLDWGYEGLEETLQTLANAKIKYGGAGRNLKEAEEPAVLELTEKSRVLVFSFGSPSSGIPLAWAAFKEKPGINMITEWSRQACKYVKAQVQRLKRYGDIVIASVHWGDNWGYTISQAQKQFAHYLINAAGIDILYGHSSHHVKGIEVYQDKLILYGCGDFLNDYEGIGGYEYYRGDLALMYLANIQPATGKLLQLNMYPTRIKHFRVNRAAAEEALWLFNTLNTEGKSLGTSVTLNSDHTLSLSWR